jgi:predicted dehydrogenase
MSALRVINFGVIGCGLMGREFASAIARWAHLTDPKTAKTLDFAPRLVAVCDLEPQLMDWFTDNFSSIKTVSTDYHALLEAQEIEAIYCAVPHHLHAQIYADIVRAEKHLLGEKPFGIDRPANDQINAAIADHPDVLARCSSEFPFYPGAYRIARWMRERRFGQIIEVEAGFWHSSDLDPQKPINWKRMVEINGEYGSMGDLGMHVVHLPFRAGWIPTNVRALLSNIVTRRPGPEGALVPCETWDNAILACEVETEEQSFPLFLSTKRIAPGEMNTWFLRVLGMNFSAVYSTKTPKTLFTLPYVPGGLQAWHVEDLGYDSAYPAITGGIFEFGFPDAILQMWAAFCDELVNGRAGMGQPFYCVTPEEATWSHELFTAALASQRNKETVRVSSKLEP